MTVFRKKVIKFQISLKSSKGGRIVSCVWTEGRTDGQRYDEANSKFSQFCETLYKQIHNIILLDVRLLYDFL